MEANLKCCEKYGAVPLTCSALQSDWVRREVVVQVDDTIDVDIDPKPNLLYNLDIDKKVCYTILTSKYYDGNQFKCTHQE